MNAKSVMGLVVCAAMVGSAQPVAAQFTVGHTDVGFTIGLGNVGSANLAVGGRLGHGLKPLPELGSGILGLEFSADFYSWSGNGYSWTYVPVGATADYHFKLANAKVDPFLGLGLGFRIISCTDPGSGANLCSNSALYFIGRAGGRYFFKPSTALYADLGSGAATLNVGLMFTVND